MSAAIWLFIVLIAAQTLLAERFALQHATLQVEVGSDERCHDLHW